MDRKQNNPCSGCIHDGNCDEQKMFEQLSDQGNAKLESHTGVDPLVALIGLVLVAAILDGPPEGTRLN